MAKSIFYHAGCPVCVSAEHDIVNLLGSDKVEVVHFGNDKSRIDEAENGNVLHINFGASMADVKG